MTRWSRERSQSKGSIDVPVAPRPWRTITGGPEPISMKKVSTPAARTRSACGLRAARVAPSIMLSSWRARDRFPWTSSRPSRKASTPDREPRRMALMRPGSPVTVADAEPTCARTVQASDPA